MSRFLLLLLIGAAVYAADTPAETKPAEGTVIVPLSGRFPLCDGSLFGGVELTLHEAVFRLQKALKAPEPRVVLDLTGSFDPSLSAAEELAAILKTREAGKTVYCVLDSCEDNTLVVAAACDHVVMAEAGILMVDGLSLSMDYYADALAKLGVKFHAITSGKAKSAPEQFTMNAPSPTAIAEHQQLLDNLDKVLRTSSARANFDEAKIKAAREQSPQTSAIALKTGIVDELVEPGAWLADQPKPVRYVYGDDNTPDLSNFAGLMSFWATMLNGEQKSKQPHVVAVVELEGMIVDGEASAPGSTICGIDTAQIFEDLAADERVVAVVVRVNSGGGSADASDRIHHAIVRCNRVKPVVALFDSVAASGGYYLGCAAREILVHHGTITGSIGVFGMVPDLTGTRDLLGIHRHSITTGPRADLFETGPMTEEKQKAIRQIIDDVDVRFQGLVSQNRKIAAEKVKDLAGGRVYTGEQAVDLGLADGYGTLTTTVIHARELAGWKDPLPIERYPHQRGLARLFGQRGARGTQVLLGSIVQMAGDCPLLAQLMSLAGQRRPLVMAWADSVDLR